MTRSSLHTYDPIPLMHALPRVAYYDIPAAIAKQTIRKWSWPAMKPYLGFSNVERIRLWQFQWLMVTAGSYKPDKVCNVCNTHDFKTVLHSENYYDYAVSVPLCHSCHMALHQRGSRPNGWRNVVAKHSRTGEEWFCKLPPMNFDMAKYMRDNFGPEVTDLYSGRLFHLPKDLPVLPLIAD